MAQTGALPNVQILEVCRSRAASLEAETQWAQTLICEGVTLHNRLYYQSKPLSKRRLQNVSKRRFWNLTLAEAYAIRLKMSLSCPSGCFATEVDIAHYAGGAFPNVKLSALRGMLQPCADCKKRVHVTFEATDEHGASTDPR